jgi:hypothetical protein
MKLFELRLHLIAPLSVVCCLICVASQLAQAQSATSTLFVANTTCASCQAVPPVGLVLGAGTAIPSSDPLTGQAVTLNGTSYGNVAKFGGGNGGPTGWIHVSYSVPEGTPTGNYTLQFEVSHAGDSNIPSALAIDHIVSPHFSESFEDDGVLPSNWTLSVGASGFSGPTGGASSSVANLAPTDGSYFAWITNGCQANGGAGNPDGCNNTLGSVSTAYGSLYQGPGTNGLPPGQGLGNATVGTTLKSPTFTLAAGDTISFDVNFLTADGTYDFSDFATAQLVFTSADSTIITFSPSATPQTQIATIGNPTDPAAQSLALTLASVTNAINVSATFFYESTDVSNHFHPGVGIADGVCEAGATEETDFDCRLKTDFTYPAPLLPTGDKLVPHIIPSHNNLGVWVRVTATRVSDSKPAVAGTDYAGPVEWFYAWNTNPSLANPTPNADYIPGWNNQNPQVYDRPGENVDIAFVANITTFSKNCTSTTCVGTADPGVGGKTRTLNDIVVAAPPNPSGTADTVELLLPVSGTSPFPYLKRLPMLVSFVLENEIKEKSDPTALTPPHSVTVGTLDPSGNPIPVQYPAGFPTTFTYNTFTKTYYIFLSAAPYKTDGTVYTLQIDSDLFPNPVNVKFVVKNF